MPGLAMIGDPSMEKHSRSVSPKDKRIRKRYRATFPNPPEVPRRNIGITELDCIQCISRLLDEFSVQEQESNGSSVSTQTPQPVSETCPRANNGCGLGLMATTPSLDSRRVLVWKACGDSFLIPYQTAISSEGSQHLGSGHTGYSLLAHVH